MSPGPTGRALIECKAELPHGEFLEALRLAGLDRRESDRFMAVAGHPLIANRGHAPYLPGAYTTLYELSRLEPEVLEEAIEEGKVRPDMTRAEVAA